MTEAPPTDLDALRATAQAATASRSWPQAVARWSALAAAGPADAEAQLRLAEAHWFNRQPAEAAEAARLAARLQPNDSRPLVLLARAEAMRDPVAAMAAWRRVVAVAPDEFEAWARLAELLDGQGDMHGAQEAMLRALALRPRHPFALALAARLLGALPPGLRRARVPEMVAAVSPGAGLALLHVAAELAPHDMPAQQALAQALLARRADELALPPLRALAQTEPLAPEPLATLAEALQRCGRWQEAAEAWRRLLRLDPEDAQAAQHLAEALRKAEEPVADPPPAAVAEAEAPGKAPALPEAPAEAAPQAPPPGAAEREAARAAVQRQDWPGAKLAWDRLLALLPRDAEALLGAAAALLQQRHLAEARQAYAHALRLGAGAEAMRGLGRILLAQNDHQGARPLWEALLRLTPGDLEVVLRNAESQARAGDVRAALAVLEAGRRTLGNDANLIRLQARLHTEAGNPAAALPLWDSLAQALPQDAEAQLQAGLAARAVGNGTLAERRLRAALAGPAMPRATAALVPLLTPADPAGARALLRRGLRQAPAEALLWRAAAQHLRQRGRALVLQRGLARLAARAEAGPATAGDGPGIARLALADRLADADHTASARQELERLLAVPELAPAAAERLARLALAQGDVATAEATLQRHPALPPALRQEIGQAGRFMHRLRGETKETDPYRALWRRVALVAQGRGFPRYLPRPNSVLHVAAGADLGTAMAAARARAGRLASPASAAPGKAQDSRITLLHAEPVPPPATAGVNTGCLADHAMSVPEVLATLPELAVPVGSFGEALRPRMVGQLAAALAASQPMTVMLWSLPSLAPAALAALAQGVPRLVLCATGAAPGEGPAGTEAEASRLPQLRLALQAALRQGGARLWHAEPAGLAAWAAWLELDAAEAAACCDTEAWP